MNLTDNEKNLIGQFYEHETMREAVMKYFLFKAYEFIISSFQSSLNMSDKELADRVRLGELMENSVKLCLKDMQQYSRQTQRANKGSPSV